MGQKWRFSEGWGGLKFNDIYIYIIYIYNIYINIHTYTNIYTYLFFCRKREREDGEERVGKGGEEKEGGWDGFTKQLASKRTGILLRKQWCALCGPRGCEGRIKL